MQKLENRQLTSAGNFSHKPNIKFKKTLLPNLEKPL